MDEAWDQFPDDQWDAGFEGGRCIVLARLWPFTRVFPRPPEFQRRWWHNVYQLAVHDWKIPLETLNLDQLCVIESELRIRYQPTLRYAKEHLDFLPNLHAQLENSLEALLKDIAEQEIRRMENDSTWLEDGCHGIEKSVAGIINEVLVMRGIHCRTICRIEPRFADVDAIDLDALPPWLRNQAVYEEYLRRRRQARERILREQTEELANAKRLLMEREAVLQELARQEEEQRKARRDLETEALQAQLTAAEVRLAEQLESETRKREEQLQHESRLRRMQAENEMKQKEAELEKQRAELAAEATRLAEQLESETRRRDQELQHQARVRQMLAEAELKASDSELAKQRTKLEAEEVRRSEQKETELRRHWDQLQHEAWLKKMQAETETRSRLAELETQRSIEEARLAHQRESEARQREAQLRHETHLLQLQTEAELKAREMELERLRAEMAKVETQLEEQRKCEVRQREEQLRHEAKMRELQTEQELKEKELRSPAITELENYLSREIGLLATERQRLMLEEEIREVKLTRTQGLLANARRILELGQKTNVSELTEKEG